MKTELIGIYDDYNNKMVNHEVAETVQAGYSKMHRGNILIIRNATKQGYKEATVDDIIDLTSATTTGHRAVVQKGKSQTIVCADGGGRGVVIKKQDDLKIRKLTPRECFRLQGVRDDDIDKLMHMSDTTLYHLAGDAIVVNVLMEIFKELI